MKEPQPLAALSPEETQIRGVAGAIQRADFALSTLKELPLTTDNFEKIQQTVDWLDGVRENLIKEMGEIRAHMPPPPSKEPN